MCISVGRSGVSPFDRCGYPQDEKKGRLLTCAPCSPVPLFPCSPVLKEVIIFRAIHRHVLHMPLHVCHAWISHICARLDLVGWKCAHLNVGGRVPLPRAICLMPFPRPKLNSKPKTQFSGVSSRVKRFVCW